MEIWWTSLPSFTSRKVVVPAAMLAGAMKANSLACTVTTGCLNAFDAVAAPLIEGNATAATTNSAAGTARSMDDLGEREERRTYDRRAVPRGRLCRHRFDSAAIRDVAESARAWNDGSPSRHARTTAV